MGPMIYVLLLFPVPGRGILVYALVSGDPLSKTGIIRRSEKPVGFRIGIGIVLLSIPILVIFVAIGFFMFCSTTRFPVNSKAA